MASLFVRAFVLWKGCWFRMSVIILMFLVGGGVASGFLTSLVSLVTKSEEILFLVSHFIHGFVFLVCFCSLVNMVRHESGILRSVGDSLRIIPALFAFSVLSFLIHYIFFLYVPLPALFPVLGNLEAILFIIGTVGGLIVSVLFSQSIFALVAEGHNPWEAHIRSFRYVRGRAFGVFFRLLFPVLLIMLLFFGFVFVSMFIASAALAVVFLFLFIICIVFLLPAIFACYLFELYKNLAATDTRTTGGSAPLTISLVIGTCVCIAIAAALFRGAVLFESTEPSVPGFDYLFHPAVDFHMGTDPDKQPVILPIEFHSPGAAE